MNRETIFETECFFNLFLELRSNTLEQLWFKIEKILGFRNLQEMLENIHSFNDLILTNIISFCPNVKLFKLAVWIFLQILGEQSKIFMTRKYWKKEILWIFGPQVQTENITTNILLLHSKIHVFWEGHKVKKQIFTLLNDVRNKLKIWVFQFFKTLLSSKKYKSMILDSVDLPETNKRKGFVLVEITLAH